MKKTLIVLLIIVFLNSLISPLYAYTQVPAYLCEIGIKLYNQGKYSEALHEFNKALIAHPDYAPALEYIRKIEKKSELKPEEVVLPKEAVPTPAVTILPAPEVKITPKEVIPPPVLILDENVKTALKSIEIELGKSMLIAGKNISRFLVTQPDILTVERKSIDELLVTGKNLGYTYLHVWDAQDRWTLEFLTVPPKPEGPTYEELLRKEEEKAGNFKLRYSIDWVSYETGRRLNKLERAFYSWSHGLNLTGETPYGNLDSSVSIRSLKTTTDLTYFTLGLEQGRFLSFKDFRIRTFDYSPNIANLAFPGRSLRGAMLNSPAFNKKIDYTVFWGREGGGRYAGLSPGLAKIKNSFLSGFDMNFSGIEKQNYGFSVFRGWGRDRPDDLNAYGYDLDVDYHFDKWALGYEVAYDSETFAYLLNTKYTMPKLKLTTELRNTARDFKTMTGWGWRVGEIGLLSSVSCVPFEKLTLNTRLDVFKDRLYPNPSNDERWNQDLDWDANYTIDPLTNLRLDYSLQNELGRLSPRRSHGMGMSLYRTFDWVKKVNAYVSYRHQENKNYTSAASDYINDKIMLGLRLSLIGDLYYYLNKELDWTQVRYTGEKASPHALETGLDWYGRILKSPFWANMRFTYRDEEDATSPFSFLSGEDYIEGYAELNYKPQPDTEIYCSTRIRNVWADNPSVNKHMEANFNAGMRYLWDTGVRWESVGTIDGYVFKDFNSDGLRQRDEPPVEGVKIWLGKDKFQITDILGYYNFTKIKAKKAYINIDTTTIPSGFTLTVPATQETAIAHRQVTQINFGIASRTEIAGVVYEDVDGDGKLGPKDAGIAGAVLKLEDGTQAMTDSSGRYYFKKAVVGKHTFTLEMSSLSPEYIPAVPIFKDIELFEGTSYVYNIPLKKIKK